MAGQLSVRTPGSKCACSKHKGKECLQETAERQVLGHEQV